MMFLLLYCCTDMLQKSNAASPFLPLDLAMYDANRRPAGPPHNNSGHITVEAALQAHDRFESISGSDQSDLQSATQYDDPGQVSSLAMKV